LTPQLAAAFVAVAMTLGQAAAPLALAATPPDQPQPAPPSTPAPLSPEDASTAQRLAVDACQACHAGTMLSQQRLTPQQWQASVKKMRGWGAELTDAEADLLARYLASRYGPDAPPAAPAEVDAARAQAAIAPLPDGAAARGDLETGKRVYATLCASCHGADARGASPAPNLVDTPILYRLPELAKVVREGRGRMAPQTVDDEVLTSLAAYLRTLR
jgi:mono/diheme cytochrome c family protein